MAGKGRALSGTDPATHQVRSATIVLLDWVAFAEAAQDVLTVRPDLPPKSV